MKKTFTKFFLSRIFKVSKLTKIKQITKHIRAKMEVFNMYLTKGNIQIQIKKRFSTILFIREMQMKSTTKQNNTPIRKYISKDCSFQLLTRMRSYWDSNKPDWDIPLLCIYEREVIHVSIWKLVHKCPHQLYL